MSYRVQVFQKVTRKTLYQVELLGFCEECEYRGTSKEHDATGCKAFNKWIVKKHVTTREVAGGLQKTKGMVG